MPSGTYIWSQTAAANGNSDSNINFLEGQAPSTLNDSSRSLMAVLKKHDDDIAGAIATSGTSTAFTVSSYSTFDSLAHMSGQLLAFTPHTTSGATPTLNVDGLGAKTIRAAPGVDLPAGALIQGTPYLCLYNNSDAIWYLHGGGGALANAYSIPLGGGITYWGSSAPSSIFALAQGQAISRSTYSALFSLFGTTYGSGDGSTTFNIPDMVGRVTAMRDAGSARISSSYFGGNPANLGAVGGSESHTLTTAQLASHTHSNSLSDPGHSHSVNNHSYWTTNAGTGVGGGGQFGVAGTTSISINSNTTGISINNASAGSGSAHNNVQPTIISNHLVRVL